MLFHLIEFLFKVYHYLLQISLVGILLSRKTKSKCRLAKTPNQNILYNQAHVQHMGRNVPSQITIDPLLQFRNTLAKKFQ